MSMQLSSIGPIIQSREDAHKGHYRHARCLACGGRVEMYAQDLGTCQSCGADFYMVWMGKNQYRCRAIPV
jgi:Zn finger protein HypA/HybF involved in hydrogenase expression